MPSWNREGFKIGLCEVPALENNVSMMTLSNSDVINDVFGSVSDRFNKLWRRKAMVHHYTQYCEEAEFSESIESLAGVMEEYATVGQRGRGADTKDERIWDVNRSGAGRVLF
jgi:tubulin epsilon